MKNTIRNKFARLAGSAIAAFVLMGSAFTADAAAYIKIGDIKGEAADTDHKEWIDILSVSQSITRGEGLTGQSRRRGDVVLGDIVCVKELDKSSPKLAEAVCTGAIIPSIEIELTRPVPNADGTTGRVVYLRYELKNVMITSYSVNGSAQGEDVPMEDFSLNFEEIKVTYTEQDKDTGQAKGNVEYSWKVEEGEK